MAVFNEPTQWDHELGNNADVSTLPDDTGATTGLASLQKLFQIINQTPLQAGGVAPDREDFNALFKYLGDQIFYTQNGGVPSYNADYDYIAGRVVLYNGNIYKCIQTNGASSTVVAPDSDDTYWQQLDKPSSALLPNQLIISPVPMTEANLHLLDGALLSGSGAYADYVTMMSELYNADPTANCWTDEATWQASVTTYGECGKFVYDSVNNTLRLPKLKSFIQATTTASELGSLVEAGAPNITGGWTGGQNYGAGISIGGENPTPNGCVEFDLQSCLQNNSDETRDAVKTVKIDASKSNSIYGNSNTIQPQAIKYYFYIVVGTISKTDIQIDIDNVLTDLNGKADTDLSNLSAVGLNKFANTDFSNVTAPTQAFKNMSIGWVMPDYDSAIDIKSSLSTSPTQITIAKDSYLQAKATYSGAFARILYVDGVEVLTVSGYASPAQSGLIPIKAGVHSMYVDAISYVDYIKVIPMLGAN